MTRFTLEYLPSMRHSLALIPQVLRRIQFILLRFEIVYAVYKGVLCNNATLIVESFIRGSTQSF